MLRDRVYVNMATIPQRIESLKMVIPSIYGQTDELNVYLNGFDDIPEFLKRPGINIARSQDYGDKGDAGKFFWSDKVNGYYLTIDDDILYPRGYVSKIIEGIDSRNKEVPVGMHGEIFKNQINHWTRDRLGTYHFAMEVKKDAPACVIGTGCMGYHTEGVSVKPEDFRIPNMADVWFTRICVEQRKPRIVLSHPQGWLKIIPIPHNDTLWGKTVNEELQNPNGVSKEVREIQPCLPWEYLYDPLEKR